MTFNHTHTTQSSNQQRCWHSTIPLIVVIRVRDLNHVLSLMRSFNHYPHLIDGRFRSALLLVRLTTLLLPTLGYLHVLSLPSSGKRLNIAADILSSVLCSDQAEDLDIQQVSRFTHSFIHFRIQREDSSHQSLNYYLTSLDSGFKAAYIHEFVLD